MDSSKELRYGYRKVKEGYNEVYRAFLMPPDDQLELITFDLELLLEAVHERKTSERPYYLSLDEILLLRSNREWQTQCAIAEHIVDFAHDSPKLTGA